ncbi:MAG: hypothetical protein Q9157_004478 [Trypethelium eluteriae]
MHKLGVDSSSYSDKSPKGSVDEQIVDLIQDINAIDGLVTTSSCAGRISVFLDSLNRMQSAQKPQKDAHENSIEDINQERGRWLFSSHTPLDIQHAPTETPEIMTLFSLHRLEQKGENDNILSSAESISRRRCIHFKFEPMILHIATASLEDTQKVLTTAISAGFRESGAVNFDLGPDGTIAPMVAVRSTGLASDTVIGYQDSSGLPLSIVDESYLRALVSVANDRFLVNQERIDRFRSALKDKYNDSAHGTKRSSNRENRALRKDMKRAEGLRRQMMERRTRAHEATGFQTNAIDKEEYSSLEYGLGLPE